MVEIKKVNFAYKNEKQSQILDANINIDNGEFVLFCGKSGSGKTSATKLINGLIPHFIEGSFIGSVKINNKETKELKMYEIAKMIGSIFQNPKTQFFNLDTDGELAFGLENMGITREEIIERINNVVDELGIMHLLNKSVFELSSGEKQILAIASVYATNPDIYVFDEPSANIDEKGIQIIYKILKKLKEQGKTVIIAEHRLYYFLDLIDKVFYFKQGKIKKFFTGEEFRKLDDKERKDLGLRTLVKPQKISVHTKDISDGSSDLIMSNISCSIKNKLIIKDINLSANLGDIIAVTGANGVGKTTIMKCLCGLIKENKGNIFWKNKKQNYKKRRALCYMLMQDVIHQLFAESVKNEFNFLNENILDKEVETILKNLDLLEFKDKHPMCLSGGQMQRLAVGVAMFSHRNIIIFDEPTSGLDYANMMAVSKMIKKMAKDKIVFIISHDKELVHNTCTRVIDLPIHI